MESRGGKATILNRMAWKGRSGQVALREVLKEVKGRAFQVDEPQGRGAGLVRGPAGGRVGAVRPASSGTQGLTRGHGSVGQTHAQQAAPPAVLRAGGGVWWGQPGGTAEVQGGDDRAQRGKW